MAGVKDYSTTASSNTTINSINIAEGMSPSNVNNAMRQMMADTRSFAEDDGWFNHGHTPVYVASTQFKIAGSDETTIYTVGRRVRLVAPTPGTIYGIITASSFSTDTTVTVTWDSGSLTNETLTSISVGQAYNPDADAIGLGNARSYDVASQAEAEAGTSSTTLMTPQRTSQAISALSGMVPLLTVSVSTQAEIEFTSVIDSTYDNYMLVFGGLTVDTDNTTISMVFSEDNGSTYLTSGYSTTSQITLCSPVGSDTGECASGRVFLYGLNSSVRKMVTNEAVWVKPDGSVADSVTHTTPTNSGWNTTANAVNAIKLKNGGTNFVSGTVTLYGLVK